MITVPPNQLIIINNSNAIFTCVSLRVFPQHHIAWTFIDSSGREIEIIHTQDGDNSSKYSINRESGTTRFGTLTIVNATFEDRGIYSCNASNEVGQAEASANLTVQGNPDDIICMESYDAKFSIYSAPHYRATFKRYIRCYWHRFTDTCVFGYWISNTIYQLVQEQHSFQ